MEPQQSNNYLRSPPTAADPYPRPPQAPPPPQSHPWPYPTNQFHYQIQHSPAPPPPQWLPAQSHLSNHALYPHFPPPPHPYHPHQPSPYTAHPHYPPPQPLPLPPRLHVYAQDFSNGNWSLHQSWDHSTNNNKEDWGEKARAWAVARAASDNQYPPAGRTEEHNHLHDHSQSVNAPLDQSSSYQQHSLGVVPSSGTGVCQLQESQFVGSGQLSYGVETHAPYAVRDGGLTENPYVSTSQQEKSSMGPFSYQQEVPSSYSSVSGNEEPVDRYENFSGSSSQHVVSMSHQPLPHAVAKSGWTEEQNHLFLTQPAESSSLRDQPLNFAPHFNRNMDQHTQPNYSLPLGGSIRSLDPTVSLPSNYACAPSSTPGVVFPPLLPKNASGPQVDHPIAVPSPASGHAAPIFPTVHSFQTTSPLIGASYGVGSGVGSYPTSSFSVEAYSVSGVLERPKKASVPNWLREEIIKNKSVIASSTPLEHPQEDSQSIEEESNDKFSRKGNQTDSKMIDYSRSNEDGDDDDGHDEEDVEAARTAAINKEIKRVLTEVLLKVTDDLFDEIATKVLNESDLSVEVGESDSSSNHHVLPSTSIISTPTASAKILLPTQSMKIDNEDGGEKSNSGTAGDVLGLSSYASDDEIKISVKLHPEENSRREQSTPDNLLADSAPFKKDNSRKNIKDENYVVNVMDGNRSSINFTSDFSDSDVKSNAHITHDTGTPRSSKGASGIEEDLMLHGISNTTKKSSTLKSVERNEKLDGNLDVNRSGDDSQSQKTLYMYHGNDIHGNSSNSVKKELKKSGCAELMSNKKRDEERERHHRENVDHHSGSKERGKEKGRIGEKAKESESRKRSSPSDEEHGRHDEKHRRTEKHANHTGSDDRGKDKGRIYEKAKVSESKKLLSPLDVKDGRSDTSKDKRTSNNESTHEKRLDKTREEKKDISRYKNGNGSSRYKPHKSSVDSRDSSKDKVTISHSLDSSDDSSDDSRRKSHRSKRHKSPSPIRSRKRQVSRSPHSKHTKRRDTPYSSFETTRGRRSRSGSPVHRRR